jgi:steroid delta-isomerase-like uncharacterized protein
MYGNTVRKTREKKERGVEEQNKTVVRRVIEGFLNYGDVSVVDDLFCPDFVDHNPSNPGMAGLENIKRSVADWHRAFPDPVNVVEELLVEEDRVAARWVTRGTHRGKFLGIPPTDNRIEVTSTGIFRMKDGRVVESWDHFDALGMLEQLGVAPNPEGSPLDD